MNKETKIVRAGLLAVAALMIVGMAFVPAVAAADTVYKVDSSHYDGTYKVTIKDGAEPTSNPLVTVSYNDVTKTLSFENASATDSVKLPSQSYSLATLFGVASLNDADVKIIDVASDIDLSEAANAFSNFFTTAAAEGAPVGTFYYLGGTTDETAVPATLFGSNTVYKVAVKNSSVQVENGADGDGAMTYATTGKAINVDTVWAFKNQVVKVAVSPKTGYSLYAWIITDAAGTKTYELKDLPAYIVKSTDEGDGATTYKVTVTAAITLEPALRDSGSTIVTYVFLNADTYVMEIPADFALGKKGTSVAEKDVKLTACDLIDDHVLKVTMASESGAPALESEFDPTHKVFHLKNLTTPTALAGYTIEAKKHYVTGGAFQFIEANNAEILDTTGLDSDEIAALLTYKETEESEPESKLKTELKFTSKGVDSTGALGKYKDKLTFTVSIATA